MAKARGSHVKKPRGTTGFEAIADSHLGQTLEDWEAMVSFVQGQRDMVKREINRRERRRRHGR